MIETRESVSPKVWLWIIATGFLLLAIGFWIGHSLKESTDDSPTQSRSVAVTFRSLGETVSASGRVLPYQLVEIGAQVSGQLKALHVGEGDRVQEGDLIAEIDATIQQNQVAETEAILLVEQTRLETQGSARKLAKTEFDRQSKLLEDGNTTQVDLDRARDALLRAELGVVQLESHLESLRARLAKDRALLAYSRIFAPMSGTVIEVNATEGQTLTATYATPVLLKIADLSRMTVESEVSELDVRKLSEHMGVRFKTRSSRNREWSSTLRLIRPVGSVVGNRVNYAAIFDVDNTDRALMPGMSAQVLFEIKDPRRVLSVPLDMVFNIGTDDSEPGIQAEVLVENQKGSLQRKQVVLGEFSHTHAEVLSGLIEGERIVKLID